MKLASPSPAVPLLPFLGRASSRLSASPESTAARGRNAATARDGRPGREAAPGGRRALQGPQQERAPRRLRRLAAPRGRARRRPRRADDARGEGGADGRPVAASWAPTDAERAAHLRGEPVQRRPGAMSRRATTDALIKRHIVQFINRENRDPRTMATWLNAVQQMAEGRRLGTPVLFVTNPRNHYGAPATFGIAEAAAPSRSGRGRSASRPRETPRWSRSSPPSPRRSTSRSGSAAPTTRRPMSRPSRAGGASGRRSARTPTLTAEMIAAVVRGFQGRSWGPGASR